MTRSAQLLVGLAVLASAAARAQEVVEVKPGESVERHISSDVPLTPWVLDPQVLETELGDRLEEREVVGDAPETVKLTDLVPPIRFESGVVEIPPSTIERLRKTLQSMRHLDNVRLHLVGHADDQPLSESLAGVFGDNEGLSRERAGEVAEFLQTALALPPEAISFEWAGDRQPVASNATPEGRALNRRVEVEVWYDELREKVSVQEVVVSDEIKRIKVCRMETVCKLRYREGHEHRARIRNLIPPLPVADDRVGLPDGFVQQVAEALHNLRDKRNVQVKFIGFTDDAPLVGREERIYGTHLALSKARAHRVALAVQDALELPTAAVASDGRGAASPLASNETERGRALNRRVEVEFWHDDPLQELPEEFQPCPDASDAETVTKVYDPPWGRIPELRIEDGDPVIPPGYEETLLRALEDVGDRTRVRLRFVGYTGNERLERRTALVYGDDIGLSVARARRTQEDIRARLGLSGDQVEHEGRGYVHAEDVVNGGFLQGAESHVAVQVVYDELAILDDYEGVEVTPITRELSPENPLALNLMRITVDGKPIDDPGRSSADIQRCTDVALERADIRFRFDDLEAEPRLSVTSQPAAVALDASSEAAPDAGAVRFQMYTNYPHFIERAEIRIFDREQSVRSTPLDVVEVGWDGLADWRPAAAQVTPPRRELQFVLRAYDEEGRFDETKPQPLWMVSSQAGPVLQVPWLPGDGESERAGLDESEEASPYAALLDGYGRSGLVLQNIPLGNAGTVNVHGSGIPPRHSVWLAGEPVPVDADGKFAAETLLPSGTHTVEVAVLDEEGNGELFLRDLDFPKDDFFYVGIADVTLQPYSSGGPSKELQGQGAADVDSLAEGRLAFYVKGHFGERWKLTASADTREEPVDKLFTNLLDKSPESLFRRLDPDYHYPTFGDDGTVEENAPTSGKFFVKLSHDQSHAMWGNFRVGYLDNELAQVDRGLYGANLRYQSDSTTSFGEQKLVVDGFAAEPGTVGSREEFRGTGGSLYYLREQDLLIGSERLRIELRDKDSGLVTGMVQLQPNVDYEIDYIQGRILLTEPLGSTVADNLLVRTSGLSGDDAWLVVQYEYTPGFSDVNAMAAGGQGHYWLNDFVKLGLTANRNEEGGSDSSLYAADLTFRKSAESWLKIQAGRSEGLVSRSYLSEDGGFGFLDDPVLGFQSADAGAYRADVSVGIGDFIEGAQGSVSVYAQLADAGYSAPGMNTLTDTQHFGGSLRIPVTEKLQLAAKADRLLQDQGLQTTTGEVDVGYQLTEQWSVSGGVRHDLREDDSQFPPVTQEEGNRTDAVVQVAYARPRWRSYSFAQATLVKTGDREKNNRFGVGGAYRLSDRLMLEGEVSHGDLGPAARLGTTYQQSDRTNMYFNYTLENERTDGALYGRQGSMVAGARTRLSDSSSVYYENRFQHSKASNGLSRAMGVNLAPSDRWNLGASWENGTLFNFQTHAETRRKAGGVRLGYGYETFSLASAIEYRFDETEQLDGSWSDRTTWLFRNTFRYQMTPSGRLVGKFNHSFSDSSLGTFYDGGFTEAVVGFAYRPVENDRFDALAKYTYFYNVPHSDQVLLQDTSAEFIQKSHVLSLDVGYDLTANWSLGGKYAYRLGEVSPDKENPTFFDNSAHLAILRTDLRVLKHWEGLVEGRMLYMPDLNERRAGALVSVYRYLGDHFKVGVGYNFTDYSEDLTDLSYDHRGVFINLVGTM